MKTRLLTCISISSSSSSSSGGSSSIVDRRVYPLIHKTVNYSIHLFRMDVLRFQHSYTCTRHMPHAHTSTRGVYTCMLVGVCACVRMSICLHESTIEWIFLDLASKMTTHALHSHFHHYINNCIHGVQTVSMFQLNAPIRVYANVFGKCVRVCACEPKTFLVHVVYRCIYFSIQPTG